MRGVLNMFSYIDQSGQTQYNVVNIVVDTETDILSLPTNVAPGSTCFVIDTSTAFMLNNQHQWKELS